MVEVVSERVAGFHRFPPLAFKSIHQGFGECEEISNVPIFILVLLVDRAHQRRGWREDLIDEDEDGLLGAQLDPLADHVDELAYGEIGGDEVLLLVDSRDVRLLDLFADDGDAVRVLLAL
jgi:hypothetical protein